MFLMSSHNRVGHPSFITSPRKSSSEGSCSPLESPPPARSSASVCSHGCMPLILHWPSAWATTTLSSFVQ